MTTIEIAENLAETFPFPKIVSGGQTGADQAGLDFALQHGIPHGGWCPKGRINENGVIPDCYHLMETESSDYDERTERNVIDADATVVFSLSEILTGASKLTHELAKKHHKPCLPIHGKRVNPGKALSEFLRRHSIRVLNVAGPRASTEPGIGPFVMKVLNEARSAFMGSNARRGPG